MICLDRSFLIDRFRDREYTQTYLSTIDGSVPVVVPTIVLHELYTGALRSGQTKSTGEIREALVGTQFAPFDDGAAEEAAVIRSMLADQSELINPLDMLTAGVARRLGATVVAVDRDYSRVPDLDVADPKER